MSCKNICIAMLFCISCNLPAMADELKDYLKLQISNPVSDKSAFEQWQLILITSQAIRLPYGEKEDLRDIHELAIAFDRRCLETFKTITLAPGETYTPSPEALELCRIQGPLIMEEMVGKFSKEPFLRVIQVKNISELIHFSKRIKIVDPSFLSVKRFREKLELTADQTKDLDKIYSEHMAANAEALESFFDEVDKLNVEKLSKMNEGMSTEQRRITKRLIATPVNWTRLIIDGDRNEMLDEIDRHCFLAIEEVLFDCKFPEGCNMTREELATTEIDNLKWPHLDSFLSVFIGTDFISNELEISDAQKIEIQGFLAHARQTSIVSSRYIGHRREELLNGSAKYPEGLEKILVPSQLEALKNVELQVFTADNQDAFGLTHLTMVKQLELTDGEAQRIQSIAHEYMEPIAEQVKLAEIEFMRVGFEYGKKRIEILEPKDRERFQLITGVDVDQAEEIMRQVTEPKQD